jgi:DNA anti-recombination protein RmuC
VKKANIPPSHDMATKHSAPEKLLLTSIPSVDSLQPLGISQIPECTGYCLSLQKKQMSEKESKLKQMLHDLSNKIDELLEQSDISKDDVKKEIDARIRELKRSRDETAKEFQRIKEENKETIEKVEKMARKTAGEIKSAFSGFMEKISKEEDKADDNEDKKN